MEEISPTVVVKNHDRLSALFDGWPSFHDAEVTDISLFRGDMRPDDGKYEFPVLTAKIVVQELVQDSTDQAKLNMVPRACVTIQFRDICELKLDDFNHLNMISALSFSLLPRGTYTNGEPLPPHIFVEFVRGFGVAISFKCFGVEVISATAA